jgi:hypothetical protein
MKWTALLFIGFWTSALYAQTNPDPAVSHPVVCKKEGGVGPAGNCVPFDPNNPEHRKLLDKMNQTPPDVRSVPPVQPPPSPDPVTSLAPMDFQTPPLITAANPAIAPKPQTNTATELYCDLACSQAKLHQFDTPSSQPGQAPPGAGALWGVSQALSQQQQQRRQVVGQRQEQELRDSTERLNQAEQQLEQRQRQKVQERNCAGCNLNAVLPPGISSTDFDAVMFLQPDMQRGQRNQQRLNAWRQRNPTEEELKALRADIRQSLTGQGLSQFVNLNASTDMTGLTAEQRQHVGDDVCQSIHKQGDYIYMMGGMMCYEGADGLLHATAPE